MGLLPRSYGGRVWFRLSDVPLDKRIKAAEQLGDQLAKQRFDMTDLLADFGRRTEEAAELLAIAENPSDKVWRISEAAWTKVMGAPP